MKEKGSDGVIESAKKTLGLAVLGRRLRTGEAQQDAMGCQEGCRGVIDELGAIIRFNALERQAKLCMNILDEGSNVLVHLILTLTWGTSSSSG